MSDRTASTGSDPMRDLAESLERMQRRIEDLERRSEQALPAGLRLDSVLLAGGVRQLWVTNPATGGSVLLATI